MKDRLVALIFICLSCLSAGVGAGAESSQGISVGRWSGKLSIKSGDPAKAPLSSEMALRLLQPSRGALMDIPEQAMFGYPLDEVSWSPTRLRFVLDVLGPGEELRFDGLYVASPLQQIEVQSAKAGSIVGTVSSKSYKGSFLLRRADAEPIEGETPFEIEVKDGALPGSLRAPKDGSDRYPLVIFFSGAGAADRNGNNYNVPGKTDSLAQLASGLASRGVGSFRFDKRGSGESYTLERNGVQATLGELADDGVAVVKAFLGKDAYPRVVVAGMNEGAWVAAMAVAKLEEEGVEVDGLVAMAASGESPRESLENMIQGLDEEHRDEAGRLVQALLAGKEIPTPSAALADFFSAGRLPWLASWLAVEPAKLFASVGAPVLFAYGGEDLQSDRPSFEKLLEARPGSAARLVPTMNYALKTTSSEKDNYESFTDPSFPVSQDLLDLLAAFAKAKPAPSGTSPYRLLGPR